MRAPHPFPARMAPDIALSMVAQELSGPVLDPMCGSGMVLKAAASAGHNALGSDLDPLAVLMSSVWTGPVIPNLEEAAIQTVRGAQRLRSTYVPWIDDDPATSSFVDFWFAQSQQHDLRRLARVLDRMNGPEADALRLALSRIIITKSCGASLASDVSHSRPHRTRLTNDYDVINGFVLAARKIGLSVQDPITASVTVREGDARNLPDIATGSVGMILTSPPYLNAIDYLRGHRLALVWLGHRLGELRAIRSGSIGAERQFSIEDSDLAQLAQHLAPEGLDSRISGMLNRYLFDLDLMMAECHRVLQPGAQAVLVVGNSTLRGTYIDNARFVTSVGERQGFELVDRTQRALPPSKRYLPPPKRNEVGELSKRMRTEVILKLHKSIAA